MDLFVSFICEAAPDLQFLWVDPGIHTAVLGEMTAPRKFVLPRAHKQWIPPNIIADLSPDDAEQQSSDAY